MRRFSVCVCLKLDLKQFWEQRKKKLVTMSHTIMLTSITTTRITAGATGAPGGNHCARWVYPLTTATLRTTRGGDALLPLFGEEEPEPERGKVTCPPPPGRAVPEMGTEPQPSLPQPEVPP